MKDVVGYEELFAITEDGQIWSKRSNRFLKLTLSSGYLTATTKISGSHVCLRAHRLVAQAYIPNPDNKPQVNHKDGNKQNNHVSNLEWCTARENTQHAHDTGLAKALSGTENVNSKLSEEDVRYIRANYRPRDKEFGTRGLGIKFNIAQSTISKIINNKTYKNTN